MVDDWYLFSSRRASGEEKMPTKALLMEPQQERALVDKNLICDKSKPLLSCRIVS
jgi:hypothetical protein